MDKFKKEYYEKKEKSNLYIKKKREGEMDFLKDHRSKLANKPNFDPEHIDKIKLAENRKEMEDLDKNQR
jgi:hypothetical protein